MLPSTPPLPSSPISNILVWVECYSYMVAILASRYPDKTAQLMAYQRTIVHAHRSFVGNGWAIYDTCYRRKAAATKSLDWGQIDFTLYNETFAGRAKAIHAGTASANFIQQHPAQMPHKSQHSPPGHQRSEGLGR